MTILQRLHTMNNNGEGWFFEYLTNDDGTISAIFWASPEQVKLTQCYHDLLGTDGSYNRNRSGMTLNVGIGIDGFGDSINLW